MKKDAVSVLTAVFVPILFLTVAAESVVLYFRLPDPAPAGTSGFRMFLFCAVPVLAETAVFAVLHRILTKRRKKELAETVQRLTDRLHSADATRSDFMSNVSHDIKTPMTVINGYVSNILNGSIPREEEAKYLERIRAEVLRISGLIGIYQDVSRIDAGDWNFVFAPFDFSEQLQNTVGIFLDKLESKNLSGDFDCPDEPVTVCGDAEAIGRVLYCLIDNAVKFTPENGRVELSLRAENGFARLSVYNEGPGIPEEDLPFVFDRSFKGDRSRGCEKDSFGFGLYLCKRILDMHSQKISVESEYGKFCRFTFSLPLSDRSTITQNRY